ncbi:5'-nucleotidase C-terminal domain-containing protein [Saccharicrinis sp. 156]|uniref:5'-nucleotidase C-terminal domain-containing protein n=1 Tax=Saccharicrinis sp. 156 TaxID=3417574 RepID=UPI003D335610
MKLNILIAAMLFVIYCNACKQPYKVKSYSGENVSVDSSFTADSAMDSFIKPYKENIAAKMDRIIGVSEKELQAYKPESALSNFVSDVIQQKANEFLISNNADSLSLLTLMNVKGLRAPIPKGDISVRNIFELMPFENEIVILALSGDSIEAFFDYLGKIRGDGIAGASVRYSGTKTIEVLIDGKPMDRTKNYFLATSDYLANGGDYFGMIMNPIYRVSINCNLRDAIIERIEQKNSTGEMITAEVEGRIIFN